MTRHLSPVEISQWAAGERSRQCEDHLHECAECRGELARLQETLSDFRASVRNWSHRQSDAAPLAVWHMSRDQNSPRLRWALIAAATVLLAAIPIYQANRHQPKRDSTVDDAVLLEQIDESVSRSVPEPMERLTTLVSDGPAAAGSHTQQKK